MYNKERKFKLRDEDLLYEIMRMHSNLTSEFDPIFKAMTKAFDFTVAELQWDKEVREKLHNERRPANSYNLIRTILNVIYSVEVDNRRQGVAKPRTAGDNEFAEMVTQVLHYYLSRANFTKAQKRVVIDAVIARYGVYCVNWDYQDDPEGGLNIFACDPREFMFEPNYADPLWSKASFVMRKHQLSLEEILNQYAVNDMEMQNEILNEAKVFFEADGKRDRFVSRKLKALFTAVYETATGFSSENSAKNYLQWWDPGSGKFDVLEFHEMRTERRLVIPDNENVKLIDISDLAKDDENSNQFDNEKIQMVREQYGLKGEPKIDLQNRRFATAFVPTFRLKLNEQPYPFDSKYYIYIPQQCYDVHANPLKVQSLLDDLLDPQAHFNKTQSLQLELLGRYANKGWIMDENAINGLEEDWTSQRIAPYRRVRAGYINQIKPEEGQTISPDLVRNSYETQQLMKVISNADDEIRGQANPEIKSGKHFLAKERQQSKSFAYIFDNRDMTQVAVYEMALNFIQHFVNQQKVFRITNDDKEPKEIVVNKAEFSINEETGEIQKKIINDLDAVKFDIELSSEPYSLSAQSERDERLGNLFNAALAVNPKKADVILDMIVKNGNYPDSDSILERWEEIDTPPAVNPQAQQMQEMLLQMQQMLAKLGVEEKQEDVKHKKLKNVEDAQRIKSKGVSNVLSNLIKEPNMINAGVR